MLTAPAHDADRRTRAPTAACSPSPPAAMSDSIPNSKASGAAAAETQPAAARDFSAALTRCVWFLTGL